MRAYREEHCRVTTLGEAVSPDTPLEAILRCLLGSRGGDSVGRNASFAPATSNPACSALSDMVRTRCPGRNELRCTARGGAVAPTRGPPCGRSAALAFNGYSDRVWTRRGLVGLIALQGCPRTRGEISGMAAKTPSLQQIAILS
jgi:hypothetical protein